MWNAEVRVPSTAGFETGTVVELLVHVGDQVAVNQVIATVESEKTTVEVVAMHAGGVAEWLVEIGQQVKPGDVLLLLAGRIAPTATQENAGVAMSPADGAPVLGGRPASHGVDLACEMLVLGAGPGGYSAAFRAADLGMKTVLIERYGTLGGVCLNVGCIPSKALLHVATVIDEAAHLDLAGVAFGKPTVDWEQLKRYKDKVVGRLTGGLAGMAKQRGVAVVQGVGTFLDAHHLRVHVATDGGSQSAERPLTIRFQHAIIAAGSQPVRLPFLPQDPRVVDSTAALDLATQPDRMLILGGGIIGLEMGTVYSTLGARLDVVQKQDGLMPGVDRDLVRVWERLNAFRFDNIMLGTKAVAAEAIRDGILVHFQGPNAPDEPQLYDLVLQAVGRTPNGGRIGAENAGVSVTDRGFIPVDGQMRTNVPNIFAIGDIVGQPMLAHKAVHQGHVAAETAAGEASSFEGRVIPSVTYTNPEIAWVGLTEGQAESLNVPIRRGYFPWSASGRATANGREGGFTKLLIHAETHRVVGGGVVGAHAGELIGEVTLAIQHEMGATDIAHTIHPHPTLAESIGLSADVVLGRCTDLPPVRSADRWLV